MLQLGEETVLVIDKNGALFLHLISKLCESVNAKMKLYNGKCGHIKWSLACNVT